MNGGFGELGRPGPALLGAGRGWKFLTAPPGCPESSRCSYDLQNKGLATAGLVCEGQNDMESRNDRLGALLRQRLAARKRDGVVEPLDIVT